MRFKSTYMVGIWRNKLYSNIIGFYRKTLYPKRISIQHTRNWNWSLILIQFWWFWTFMENLSDIWFDFGLNHNLICMYIIWLFSNFRCWSTRPIFHSWIFRGGWAFFRLCGFRKSVGGQLGAHEKSRLWNNEVVQPHNRGQGSRLEGTIKEVWRFDVTFVFMAL